MDLASVFDIREPPVSRIAESMSPHTDDPGLLSRTRVVGYFNSTPPFSPLQYGSISTHRRVGTLPRSRHPDFVTPRAIASSTHCRTLGAAGAFAAVETSCVLFAPIGMAA